MATHLSREMMRGLAALRYEPTSKRIRAFAGGQAIVDTRRGILVWEPKRVVPSYAVPDDDIQARLLPAAASEGDQRADERPVLDPGISFSVHTTGGEPLTLESGAVALDGAGFRPKDADLNGYVVLDFKAFDEWLEEDERIVSHPHDPFSRIDVRRSSSRVQVEVDGVLVADSGAPKLLFETKITPRFYLPPDDVRMDLFAASQTRTTCAYKGQASYWTVTVNGNEHRDLAWSYEEPLSDAADIRDYICFFNERVDVIVDGERRVRPVTPWS
jgi:uncharacterized protein (DUF427 family)